MNLLVLGINHNSAPVAIRERAAFVPEQMEAALSDAVRQPGVAELVILSTCNRTELYAVGEEPDAMAQPLLEWLAGHSRLPSQDLLSCSYRYQDEAALRHMIEVAAGLDSMILGEPQIFGQMKSAFAVAREAGTVNADLSRVFSHVFSVAKRVRTDTAIGENPVSVAYAAVGLTQHIFADLSTCNALLIGAGETVELVARHLRDRGVRRIVIANRTLDRARELAQEFGAEAVLLADIPEHLRQTDIVVASTASQLPILGKGAVEAAIKKRKHKPMLMVDIAVPRDIEPQVGELNDVYLYTIDDLREIVDENKRARQSEARKADEIIEESLSAWHQQLRSLDAVSTVKDFRAKAETLRDRELERARRMLARGENPEKVLEQLARGLTNKLIHSPSTQLREAGAKGHTDLIRWARELFQLGRDETRDERDEE